MSLPPGASLYLNFLTSQEEEEALLYVQSQEWSTTLKRLTQHYGYLYDYKRRSSSVSTHPLDGAVASIGQRLVPFLGQEPSQCIVNRYLRDEGIVPHIDSTTFGPKIITISLGADTVMQFSHAEDYHEVFLPRRSLLLLSEDARYSWKHGISNRVTYSVSGVKHTKPLDYCRVSLTYRTLNS